MSEFNVVCALKEDFKENCVKRKYTGWSCLPCIHNRAIDRGVPAEEKGKDE